LKHILFALLFLRLMAPPGICLCKVSSPATAFFADLFGKDAPPTEQDDDDDHAPGCPASKLSEGMGLRPANVAPPDDDGVMVSLPPPEHRLTGSASLSSDPYDTPDQPGESCLYLTLCALRI
jgi:hypothetical protein